MPENSDSPACRGLLVYNECVWFVIALLFRTQREGAARGGLLRFVGVLVRSVVRGSLEKCFFKREPLKGYVRFTNQDGEPDETKPIFSCKAHVFHIDPKTKRSWISASSSAVSVSFFYDSTRSLYRIISVEGTKAVINSTITPNMTFTKTSQKFGQWSDVRANTVYGLGFSSEAELNKFIEKFQEVKEATRLAAAKANANGTSSGPGESPKHQAKTGEKAPPPTTTAPSPPTMVTGSGEAQLKYENDRLNSANAKKWEIELATLKNNNVRLTSALQESTANVEEWKRQLQSYKEENQRLKTKYIELEAAKGSTEAAVELRKELQSLRSRLESLDLESRNKDDEIKRLNKQQAAPLADQEERFKNLQQENAELQAGVSLAQAQLETAISAQESQRRVLDTLNSQLAARVQELAAIHRCGSKDSVGAVGEVKGGIVRVQSEAEAGVKGCK
uniref:WH1 domain-containing protein n=1 Tax=Timema shepardi TaxID=629360 RepID=A0A7R9APM0_TIMSH|nr:unnamed protein product [Timema shepardi]